MTENGKQPTIPHNVIVEGRSKLVLSGVVGVASYDEQSVLMHTTLGDLLVQGENLQMENLSVESGDLCITGQINGMVYRESTVGKRGLFSRIFG